MLPDPDTCYRAYQSRDARFDGRFFTAVVTTGIYCRPICPARTPLPKNVRFFAFAAAAEEAGFRACRRCRPEAAPGTPSWIGTSAVVSRGLRLIEDGYLDAHAAPQLADRLGLGERQLRRLFEAHVGVPPAQVARTRRLHFARTLVETTALPISELALASGFRSLRQFNDAFRQAFSQPPTALRQGAPAQRSPVHELSCDSGGCRFCSREEGALTLRLSYRPPLDWPGMLAFFAARALPGVEAVEKETYSRSFSVEGSSGWFTVRPGERAHSLELEVHGASARMLLPLVRRVRRLFDLDADPTAISTVLGGSAVLEESVRRRGGLRVAGAFSPFEGAVRIIVGQQVSVAAARTVLSRLCQRAGAPMQGAPGGIRRCFVSAAELAALSPAELGMPQSRGRTLLAVAALAAPELDLESLEAVPGIGPWTRSLLAMRAGGDPDAFPAGDLALRRVLPGTSEAALERLSEAWRPWRAYAAMHLWAMDSEQQQRRTDHVRAVAT